MLASAPVVRFAHEHGPPRRGGHALQHGSRASGRGAARSARGGGATTAATCGSSAATCGSPRCLARLDGRLGQLPGRQPDERADQHVGDDAPPARDLRCSRPGDGPGPCATDEMRVTRHTGCDGACSSARVGRASSGDGEQRSGTRDLRAGGRAWHRRARHLGRRGSRDPSSIVHDRPLSSRHEALTEASIDEVTPR